MKLLHGDCLAVLKTMPENSVDAIVTDPPYGLSFMGKKWDYDVPSEDIWRECLRVLKPGGHLLAFAGTRTQHRMAVRIEDAGFEIRDMIAWCYGSGFPKSLDVSKAITNRADPAKVREVKLWLAEQFERSGKTKTEINRECGFTASDYLKTEPGNDAGGRATWHLLLPYGEKWARLKQVVGFGDEFDAEIERYGVIASQRHKPKENREIYGKYSGTITDYELTDAARQWQGWGTALKPALEPITVARKPLVGTVADNVLRFGTGALNIDGCRIPSGADHADKCASVVGLASNRNGNAYSKWSGERTDSYNPAGRWPANLIHDGSDEVIEAFPVAKGQQGDLKGHNKDRESPNGVFGRFAPAKDHAARIESDTSAARFFYCAKASKKDRGDGNTHPTVKPTDLMRYLCRLVTPPGGVVLDPFMGSGSTGKAAALEGFDFIGIEREGEYVAIAESRIAAVTPDAKPAPLTESQHVLAF